MLLLPLIIAIPLFSVIALFLLDSEKSHIVAKISSVLVLAAVFAAVYEGTGSFSVPYLASAGINLHLEINSFNSILMIMAAIVYLAAAFVGDYFIKENKQMYCLLFLLAEASSLGVFLAYNLFMLYVFWEVSEIMMFFFIFVYGGSGRRYAAFKFIIYSLVSSLLLLIGIMLIYANVNPHTFDITSIVQHAQSIPNGIQLGIIVLLLVSFMIKMPLFPFHSWLPDAHTEAPTTGSMILAGVLLKFGGYGLFLLLMMLPVARHYALYIMAFAAFSAVYSSLAALKQSNIKRAIAYTSITDMGIIAVGLASYNMLGSEGGFYGMLSHGIAISLLFLIAGTLNETYNTLDMGRIKGVISDFPEITYLFIIGALAAIGIPLTSGFIADILIFIGSFRTFGLLGLIPVFGILLIGGMLLWIIEKVFISRKETEPYSEPDRSVIYTGFVLLFFSILFGIVPFVLLGLG